MNKRGLILFLSSIFSLSLVSAGPVEGFQTLLDGTLDFLRVFLDFLSRFSDIVFNANQGDFLFTKILVMLIVFIVCFVALRRNDFFGDKKIAFIISACISILAVRFIPDNDFFNGLLLPYGALGVAITTFLPFLVYFLFVNQASLGPFGRRAAWIFFGVFFVGLWWTRSSEISEQLSWMYFIVIGLIILSIIFDRQIRRIWGLRDIHRFMTGAHNRSIAALQEEYLRILPVNTPAAEARRRDIENRLRTLGGDIP